MDAGVGGEGGQRSLRTVCPGTAPAMQSRAAQGTALSPQVHSGDGQA